MVVDSLAIEFGYELIQVLPWAYYLHKQGKLTKTVSAVDTDCLYYFSPNHEEKYFKRQVTYILDNPKFPITKVHVPKLDKSQWEAPPLKEYYKNDEFVFPCIYVTYRSGDLSKWFSNINFNKHFGIPKVVFSNGISHPIVDEKGEYGLTQFAYGIVDEPKNLFFIQRAMLNPEFIELMSFVDGKVHRYDRKVISMFRKNFWEEFQPA